MAISRGFTGRPLEDYLLRFGAEPGQIEEQDESEMKASFEAFCE